jgi:hypothetical protein
MPASRGIAWVAQSWALLRTKAPRLLLIALLMQLILGLTQVPMLGILVIMSVPGFTAGILEAFHIAARGGTPALSTLFLPLTSRGQGTRLIGLGGLVFIVGVLVISALLPGGEQLPDEELISRLQQGDVEAINALDPEYLKRMMLAFLVGVAVSGTLSFFTIPLIWFRNRKLWSALAEGLQSLARNWKAFLVLGLALAAVSVPMALVIGMLFAAGGQQGPFSLILMGLVMVVLLLYQMLLFGTQYCSAREIFGFDDQAGPPPGQERDDQFVA